MLIDSNRSYFQHILLLQCNIQQQTEPKAMLATGRNLIRRRLAAPRWSGHAPINTNSVSDRSSNKLMVRTAATRSDSFQPENSSGFAAIAAAAAIFFGATTAWQQACRESAEAPCGPRTEQDTVGRPTIHSLSRQPQTLLNHPTIRTEAEPRRKGSVNNNRRHSLNVMLTRMKSLSGRGLNEKYKVDWNTVLGEGAFGSVHPARLALTGEKVALKKISKRYTNSSTFLNETNALLRQVMLQ